MTKTPPLSLEAQLFWAQPVLSDACQVLGSLTWRDTSHLLQEYRSSEASENGPESCPERAERCGYVGSLAGGTDGRAQPAPCKRLSSRAGPTKDEKSRPGRFTP